MCCLYLLNILNELSKGENIQKPPFFHLSFYKYLVLHKYLLLYFYSWLENKVKSPTTLLVNKSFYEQAITKNNTKLYTRYHYHVPGDGPRGLTQVLS